ncbi:MAG: hypothetical protein ABL949_09620 [Fimbriimonadaceae bacterium]
MKIPSDPHCPDRPFVRGRTLIQRNFRDLHAGRFYRSSSNRNPDSEILKNEVADILEHARLTQAQMAALLDRLGIKRCRNVPRQVVFRRYQRAVARIEAAYNVYPYAGLWEVYHSEQKRG